MCGIAGILKTHPAGSQLPPPDVAIPERWLDVLDDSIKHRGPDGQGRFRDRATRPDGTIVDIAFVHRRLSIIDHAGGHQPMVSDRGPHPDKPRNARVAVVFNGCIYNHRDLRRELQSAGHHFVTDHSDTEVLIHGWREWGHALFTKLDGMFAVAIWDAGSGTLVLSRDRFGEKPLYFDDDKPTVSFASTAAGLARARPARGYERGVRSDVSVPAIAAWTAFGWSATIPQRGLAAVPIGYVQIWGHWGDNELALRESVAMHRWERERPREAEMDAIDADELIAKAVRSRLEADVPMGIFLSGGLDSALVARYAAVHDPSVEAFTVRMPSPGFDESAAASATARHIGIRHHVLDCAASPSEDLVAAIRQLGLPFGDSSLLPSLWVSRAARGAVRVALGGDGGDELFLGYERHRILGPLAAARHAPQWAKNLGQFVATSQQPATSRLRSRFGRLLSALAVGRYEELLSLFPQSMRRELIDGDWNRWLGRHSGNWLPRQAEDDAAFISRALSTDLTGYLPEDLLRKTDTASMSVGLEVRAPFLARELVDRMIRVRPDVLMPDGERKGLLKQVARKYLPDSIVDRPKMGFSIPIGEWFRTDYGGMRQLLLDTLDNPDPFPEDLLGITINRRFVAQMVNDHMSRGRDHSQRLYMLLVLAIWSAWLRDINRGAAPF